MKSRRYFRDSVVFTFAPVRAKCPAVRANEWKRWVCWSYMPPAH